MEATQSISLPHNTAAYTPFSVRDFVVSFLNQLQSIQALQNIQAQHIAAQEIPGSQWHNIVFKRTQSDMKSVQYLNKIDQTKQTRRRTTGKPEQTGQPLDVALAGDPDAFFAFQSEKGIYYSRCGEFRIKTFPNGRFLVGLNDWCVLNAQGSPISIHETASASHCFLSESGDLLFQEDSGTARSLGKLGVFSFQECPEALTWKGPGIYQASTEPSATEHPDLIVHALETPNYTIDPLIETMKLQSHAQDLLYTYRLNKLIHMDPEKILVL